MGYLHKTHEYVRVALESLKNSGTVHYHEACPTNLLWKRPSQRVKRIIEKHDFRINRMERRVVKSYAPGVSHVVLDIEVERY
jgi:tRNA wybutosine-synthesizing protein 2